MLKADTNVDYRVPSSWSIKILTFKTSVTVSSREDTTISTCSLIPIELIFPVKLTLCLGMVYG